MPTPDQSNWLATALGVKSAAAPTPGGPPAAAPGAPPSPPAPIKTGSITETIVAFAAKQVVDRIFGGPTKIFTAYHKTHFIVLHRALVESSRDGEIQDSLAEITKNLAAMTQAGSDIIAGIPDPPEPPSSDLTAFTDKTKAAAFQKQIDDYAAGVQAIIGVLNDYIAQAGDCADQTNAQLKQIKSNLDMKNVKWVAMRQISNAARQQDIDLILIQDLPKLSAKVSQARTLVEKYKNQ